MRQIFLKNRCQEALTITILLCLLLCLLFTINITTSCNFSSSVMQMFKKHFGGLMPCPFKNILGWSQLFVQDQNTIDILCRYQTFCDRPIYDFQFFSFCESSKIVWTSTKCNLIFACQFGRKYSRGHLHTCSVTAL